MVPRVNVDVGDVPQHNPSVQILDDIDHVGSRLEFVLNFAVVVFKSKAVKKIQSIYKLPLQL